jgi:molybdate transport system regulatory protein
LENKHPVCLGGKDFFYRHPALHLLLYCPIIQPSHGKRLKEYFFKNRCHSRKKMKVTYKIWLDNNGKAFGEGPYELLKRVEKTNSLHEAAYQMRMSYSKAWKLIQTMEKRLGFSLLDKKIGGLSGGGSQVTPKGKELMKRYGQFEKEARKAIEKVYQKHFGSR